MRVKSNVTIRLVDGQSINPGTHSTANTGPEGKGCTYMRPMKVPSNMAPKVFPSAGKRAERGSVSSVTIVVVFCSYGTKGFSQVLVVLWHKRGDAHVRSHGGNGHSDGGIFAPYRRSYGYSAHSKRGPSSTTSECSVSSG